MVVLTPNIKNMAANIGLESGWNRTLEVAWLAQPGKLYQGCVFVNPRYTAQEVVLQDQALVYLLIFNLGEIVGRAYFL